MATFDLVTHVTREDDIDWSLITDLQIVSTATGPVLVSTTRFDGVLRSWDISGAVVSLGDQIAYQGGDLPGGTGSVMVLDLDGAQGVLTGGATGGAFQTTGFGAGATFATSTVLPAGMAGFQHGVTVSLADGTQAVYGTQAGTSGILRADFTAAGAFVASTALPAGPATAVDAITDTVTTEIAGQTFLFTASATQNAVTGWTVSAGGALAETQTLGVDDGLWISVPTAMDVATVNGVTYLVLGSAGSSTLTVMEIGTDGTLTIRDHLMDSLDTRFGGVTSVEVITHNGQTYVVAGGADDGISVFALLEGGLLLDRGHIADTTDMGLDNISAIALHGEAATIGIYAASSSEPGLTQLRYDAGPAGVTTTAVLAGGLLTGTAGNDVLQGHNGADTITAGDGDDILRDGAGSDTMAGGAGADVFILSRDGLTDTISDFTLGEDRIDLSLWPMLRDVSQLSFSLRADGVEITYGDEQLIVLSHDGEMIDYRLLTNADLIGGSRLPSDAIVPGYPGPTTPVPVIPSSSITGDTPEPADQGNAYSVSAGQAAVFASHVSDFRSITAGASPASATASATNATDALIGDSGDNLLDGGDGDDLIIGRAGADTLSGGAGGDLLLGGTGADTLFGQDGRDEIYGGAGDDLLDGGHGDDFLFGDDGQDDLAGGTGNDVLQGGADNDRLAGGTGDDTLTGGAGADTFVFGGGADEITDFVQGTDLIEIDPVLWDGLLSSADLLTLHGRIDGEQVTIDLGGGDILQFDGVTDYATLEQSISIF